MKGKSKGKSSVQPERKTGIDALFVLKALLIGIFGSILLILSNILLELFWVSPIVYNDSLRNVYFAQLAILIFLIPVFTGALAVMALSSGIKRYTYAIATGMISGVTTGIGFTATLSLFVLTINLSHSPTLDWQAIHDTLFTNPTGILATEVFQAQNLVLFTLLSIMLAGVGGSVVYTLAYYSRAKKSRVPGVIEKSPFKTIASLAAVLLLLAIVPPVLAFSGINSGLVGNQGFHYIVSVQRPNNDTLVFTNNGGDRLNDLDPALGSFILYIGSSSGGYDMSNQSLASGSNVTLDPAGGLSILPGSTLTIKGEGISALSHVNNSTGKPETHVFVIGNTTGGQELIYLDTFV